MEPDEFFKKKPCPLCHQEQLAFTICNQCGVAFCMRCYETHESSCGMFEKSTGTMSLRPYQEQCIEAILAEFGYAVSDDNDANGDGQNSRDGAPSESLAEW